MRQGLIDADIGGGLLKKRVALPGRGKRGSARVIVATKVGRYWFFLFCYEKNARATINIVRNGMPFSCMRLSSWE